MHLGGLAVDDMQPAGAGIEPDPRHSVPILAAWVKVQTPGASQYRVATGAQRGPDWTVSGRTSSSTRWR